MARSPLPGRCVHCLGHFDDLTWDHVFPESWYPDGSPPNVEKWKAPSCRPCNHAHGKNESELLVRFGLCIQPDEVGTQGIAEKAIRALDPTAGKNARDTAARAAQRARVLKSALTGPGIPTEAIYPGFGRPSGVPAEEQVAITVSATGLRRLTEKVVRGITWILHGTFVEDAYEIDHLVVNDAGAKELLVALERFGTVYDRPPGMRIRRVAAFDDKIAALFEIEIWQQLRLYASVTLREPAEADVIS